MKTTLKTILFLALFVCLSTVDAKPKPKPLPVANTGQQAVSPTLHPDKDTLILLPLRVPDSDIDLAQALGAALVQGLKVQYQVFYGSAVEAVAKKVFTEETVQHDECDETRCLQSIAIAFQTELVAISKVVLRNNEYILSLQINNVFDNKIVFTNTATCQNCTTQQLISKLRELSGSATDQAHEEAVNAAKARLENLKRLSLLDQQNADSQQGDAERQRLMLERAEDERRLTELKAKALARRNSLANEGSQGFPSFKNALLEIERLKKQIKNIEAAYTESVSQARHSVNERYAALFTALFDQKRDEFKETIEQYNSRIKKAKEALMNERDADLRLVDSGNYSATETEVLRARVKSLEEHEYLISNESIQTNLSGYLPEWQTFEVTFTGNAGIKFDYSAVIPVSASKAKLFKQQWVAGLIRPEALYKIGGTPRNLVLVNDADDSRMTHNPYFLYENTEGIGSRTHVFWSKSLVIKSIEDAMVKLEGENFEISRFELTQLQYDAVMQDNRRLTAENDDIPVYLITPPMVKKFLENLNKLTGKKYRLPTEREWETACFAGQKTAYCGGNDIDSVAWYSRDTYMLDNPESVKIESVHPVGEKRANAFGLFDMSGNADEWITLGPCVDVLLCKIRPAGGTSSDYPFHIRAQYKTPYEQGFNPERPLGAGIRLVRDI